MAQIITFGNFKGGVGKTIIAVQVASLRKSANFTQQEIAQKAHISKSTIIKIENGTIIPTLTTLDKIGKAVGKHISISFK